MHVYQPVLIHQSVSSSVSTLFFALRNLAEGQEEPPHISWQHEHSTGELMKKSIYPSNFF